MRRMAELRPSPEPTQAPAEPATPVSRVEPAAMADAQDMAVVALSTGPGPVARSVSPAASRRPAHHFAAVATRLPAGPASVRCWTPTAAASTANAVPCFVRWSPVRLAVIWRRGQVNAVLRAFKTTAPNSARRTATSRTSWSRSTRTGARPPKIAASTTTRTHAAPPAVSSSRPRTWRISGATSRATRSKTAATSAPAPLHPATHPRSSRARRVVVSRAQLRTLILHASLTDSSASRDEPRCSSLCPRWLARGC